MGDEYLLAQPKQKAPKKQYLNFQQLSHRNLPSMVLGQRIENQKNTPS